MSIDLERQAKLFYKDDPEGLSRYMQYKRGVNQQKYKFGQMDNDTLANSAEFFMGNMSGPCHHGPGAPVYDSVFWHAIMPEILRRIRDG